MLKLTDKSLLVATHNQGKLEEVSDLLRPHGISVIGAAAKGLPEPEARFEGPPGAHHGRGLPGEDSTGKRTPIM